MTKEDKNITSDKLKSDTSGLIDVLQKQVQDQQKSIEMLTQIADKKKLFLYQQKTGKKGPDIVDIRSITVEENGKSEEKIIVGWRTIKNDVNFDPVTRKWHEDQEIEVMFDDGKSQKMSYRSFILGYRRIKCKKLSEEKVEGEDFPIFRLARQDTGEEYRISAKFVN
jgi:hypothetical protein